MTREPTQTEIAYFHGESIQEHGTHAWQALKNTGLVPPETREMWPPDVPATLAKDYPIAYYVSNMLFYAKQITIVLPKPD